MLNCSDMNIDEIVFKNRRTKNKSIYSKQNQPK